MRNLLREGTIIPAKPAALGKVVLPLVAQASWQCRKGCCL